MDLPEEALRKGRITIYNDTPRKVVSAAEEYREHVDKCRKRSRDILPLHIFRCITSEGISLTKKRIIIRYLSGTTMKRWRIMRMQYKKEELLGPSFLSV